MKLVKSLTIMALAPVAACTHIPSANPLDHAVMPIAAKVCDNSCWLMECSMGNTVCKVQYSGITADEAGFLARKLEKEIKSSLGKDIAVMTEESVASQLLRAFLFGMGAGIAAAVVQ